MDRWMSRHSKGITIQPDDILQAELRLDLLVDQWEKLKRMGLHAKAHKVEQWIDQVQDSFTQQFYKDAA